MGLSYWVNLHYPDKVFNPGLTHVLRQASTLPGVLALSFIFPSKVPVIIVLSVDGDLSAPQPLRDKALRASFDLLDHLGLRGKVTWFVNQGSYDWAGRHRWALEEILARGDELALHSHFVEQHLRRGLKPGRLEIKKQIGQDKIALEEAIKSGYRIKGFRAGCLAITEVLLDTLVDLGFDYDSSIMPGVQRWFGKHLLFDYTHLPPTSNWQQIRPGLWELPLYRVSPGMTYVNVALHSRARPTVITHLLFHPHELINRYGNLNRWRCLVLKAQIWFIRRLYPDASFMTAAEVAAKLRESQQQIS